MKKNISMAAWILILLLLLPGTVFAVEKAKITVKSLDPGIELYMTEDEDSALRSVKEGSVITSDRWNVVIYFYVGAEPGYKVDDIWGKGISDTGILDLGPNVDKPGAQEAYNQGCTKYFYFTYSPNNNDRTISVSGSPLQYRVVYEGADVPADENIYTVAEGSNTIMLASAPSKQGFRFTGWQLGETLYQPGDNISLNGDLIAWANDSNQLIFCACWTQTVPYTVEYYLESEKGVYPQQPVMQLECDAEAGSSVQADLAPEGLDLNGYVFDKEHEGNILSGIAADGAGLTLRVHFALDANGNGIADRYETPSEEPEGPEEPGTPEEPSVPDPGEGGGVVPPDPEEGGSADPIPDPGEEENENVGIDPDPGTGDSGETKPVPPEPEELPGSGSEGSGTKPSSDSNADDSSEADEGAEADVPRLPVAVEDIPEPQLAVRSISQRESSDTDDDTADRSSPAEETPLIRSYSLQEIGTSGRRAESPDESGALQTIEDEDTPLADKKIPENQSRRGPAVYTIVGATTVAASGALAAGIFGYRRKIEALRKVSEMADEAVKNKK